MAVPVVPPDWLYRNRIRCVKGRGHENWAFARCSVFIRPAPGVTLARENRTPAPDNRHKTKRTGGIRPPTVGLTNGESMRGITAQASRARVSSMDRRTGRTQALARGQDRPATRRRRPGSGLTLGLVLVLLLGVGLVAGCSSDGPAADRADAAVGATPDIHGVPADRPTPPDRAELESVTEGLVADRRAARYEGSGSRRRPQEIAAPQEIAGGGGGGGGGGASLAASSPAASSPAASSPAPITSEPLAPPASAATASAPAEGGGAGGTVVRVARGTVANPPEGMGAAPPTGTPPTGTPPTGIAAGSGPAGMAGAGMAGAGPIVVDSRGVHTGLSATEMATLPAGGGPRPLSAYAASGVSVSSRVGVIYFASGSSSLDDRDRQVVREIAAYQRQYGGVLRVIGHASSRTGDMDPARHKLTNLKVSARRAEAVAQALMNAGVSPDHLFVGAVADEQKIYQEVMPSGEAYNRRAEVFLDY